MTLKSVLAALGLENPSAQDYIDAPSNRIVSSFFLGWLFFFAVQQLTLSPLLASSLRALRHLILVRRAALADTPASLEGNHVSPLEKALGIADDLSSSSHSTNSSSRRVERTNLTFTLTVSFALAALAQMISLTAFKTSHGVVACAFVVAWGGMAEQSGKIVAILRLSFDLAAMDVGRWELFTVWGWLVVSLIFMFVSNAISIGTLRDLPGVAGMSLCYRAHFLPTALLLSFINLLLEIYCVIRLFSLTAPSFLTPRDRLAAMGDIRVLRALSLVILDILTIAPSAQFFSVLADFVPFAIGAVLVVATFNCYPSTERASFVSPPRSLRTASLGSLVHAPADRESRGAEAPFPISLSPARGVHREQYEPAPLHAHTSRSIRSVSSDGDSVNGAVVRLAFREPQRRNSLDDRASGAGYFTGHDQVLDEKTSELPRTEPSARTPRIPSSIIQFASPRTSVTPSAPSSQARARRSHEAPSVPRISVQTSSSHPSAERSRSSHERSPTSPTSPSGYAHEVWRTAQPQLSLDRAASATATTGHQPMHEPSAPTADPLARPASAAFHRFSVGHGDLSVVYEASVEASGASVSEHSNPSARNRLTFGEGAFRTSRLPRGTHAPPSSEGSHQTSSPSSSGGHSAPSRANSRSPSPPLPPPPSR